MADCSNAKCRKRWNIYISKREALTEAVNLSSCNLTFDDPMVEWTSTSIVPGIFQPPNTTNSKVMERWKLYRLDTCCTWSGTSDCTLCSYWEPSSLSCCKNELSALSSSFNFWTSNSPFLHWHQFPTPISVSALSSVTSRIILWHCCNKLTRCSMVVYRQRLQIRRGLPQRR